MLKKDDQRTYYLGQLHDQFVESLDEIPYPFFPASFPHVKYKNDD